MNYRRARVAGGTYFFTVVTFMRRPILCTNEAIENIKTAFQHVMAKHPFTVDAMVVLPDHIHCLWTLPENDHDFSTRWRLIKTRFTHVYTGNTPKPSTARLKKMNKPSGNAAFGNTWSGMNLIIKTMSITSITTR